MRTQERLALTALKVMDEGISPERLGELLADYSCPYVDKESSDKRIAAINAISDFENGQELLRLQRKLDDKRIFGLS